MRRRGESFGTAMDRALRRIRKMPATTPEDRQARADALTDAMDAWKRKREQERMKAAG